MVVNIVALVLACIVAFIFIKKEKDKQRSYFGKAKKHSKNELRLLERYKQDYLKIEPDKRLPKLQAEGYEFEDIALIATENLFQKMIPLNEEKESIAVGDLVKAVYTDGDTMNERIWLAVEEIDGRLIKCSLRNELFSESSLKFGDSVWLHFNHVLAIKK